MTNKIKKSKKSKKIKLNKSKKSKQSKNTYANKKYVGGANGPHGSSKSNPDIRISLTKYAIDQKGTYKFNSVGILVPARSYQSDAYNELIKSHEVKVNYSKNGFNFDLVRMNILTGEIGLDYPVYMIRTGENARLDPISLIIDVNNKEELEKIPVEIRDHYPGITYPVSKSHKKLPTPPGKSAASSAVGPAPVTTHGHTNDYIYFAEQLRDIYENEGYSFPPWVIDPKLWNDFKFKESVVYYNTDDDLNDVIKLTIQREPCNIAMKKYYDENKLEKKFGWKHGAYELSINTKLMPNIAIYCKASLLSPGGKRIYVDVINLIGYAFDDPHQPDYNYFQTKYSGKFFNNEDAKKELVDKYSKMWRLALACAINLGKKHFSIFNVGGGAFSGRFYNFIQDIFMKSFIPLIPIFKSKNINIIGFDNDEFDTKRFIPNIFDNRDEDYNTTLYVNAWDPWTIIGNGNGNDNSLDGYWGNSTNMSVLGWFLTNPHMIFRPVLIYENNKLEKVPDIEPGEIKERASTIIKTYNGSVINQHPLHK